MHGSPSVSPVRSGESHESRSLEVARGDRSSWQSLGKVPLLWSPYRDSSRHQKGAKAARGTTRVLGLVELCFSQIVFEVQDF